MPSANVINYDEVIISEPGRVRPRRVPIAAPQVSWEISAPGAFSGFIRLEDLRHLGLIGDIKGYWLDYASSAGNWGGMITGRPTTGSVAEITAQGYAALLSGHVLSTPNIAITGSAGGLAKRVLIDAGAGNPTFVTLGTIDEGGGGIAMDLTGDVGNDLLPQIADAGDVEWMVDENRVFTLARRLGRDRSASVRLIEDRHIVDHRVNDDISSAPSVEAFRVQSELSHAIMQFTIPTPPSPLIPPGNPVPLVFQPLFTGPGWYIVGGKPALIQREVTYYPEGLPTGVQGVIDSFVSFGLAPQQTYQIENPGLVTVPTSNAPTPTWSQMAIGIGANNPAVPGTRHTAPPMVATELTIANVDQCFQSFGLADTVRIDLGSVGICGRFRVKVRALDVTTQTMTISGDLLKDE